jgi:hypothetical protein
MSRHIPMETGHSQERQNQEHKRDAHDVLVGHIVSDDLLIYS